MPLYTTWEHIIHSGTVCADWLDFDNFKAWSIDNGFQYGFALNLIHEKDGYNPNNCRWSRR